MNEEITKCGLCNRQTEWQNVDFNYPFRGKVYKIKNFPAEVCKICGEQFYHGEDLEKLNQRILKEERTKELEFSF
ncbi:MAG: YgiT-type zinc finger protein [Acidobacteriota bacterium]|jgi:YgiT-type zinc finger domain-containing protein|nr:YgiT-type zinc finger protein [Acidobacteriota bacterium]